MVLGYKLMSEEHGARALVQNARRAEEAGAGLLAISDHYLPWLESQRHSPYAWSVLGAIAAETSRAEIMTAVTCPIVRYHPAIVAQAAATLALLSEGRFLLGLGAGERLNEHVVGRGWPAVDARHAMLREAIDAIRALWSGARVTRRGAHVTVEDARLYDLPDAAPPIVVAAGGPRAARLAAACGDGLITTVPDERIIGTWREAAGRGGAFAEVPLCWAASESEGVETAHRCFRFGLLGFKVLAELPNVSSFEVATEPVGREQVREAIACGPDVERHVRQIRRYLDAGFDHLILVQAGPDQEGFLRFFERELSPQLERAAA